MTHSRFGSAVAAIVSITIVSAARPSQAADWPQYQADAARRGYTPEKLPARLSVDWVRRARHAPQPAWIGRSFARSRMHFDWACSAVVAGGSLYFGGSADCKVYALDAATGRRRWSFFAGGPVRFAPAVWKDRVFAVSDDGCLYCLSAEDGRCLWKLRGGPGDELLLGNGRMVSHWVARGAPAVRDGVVYWAAGIWPTDGVYVYAVDAATGKVLWLNDGSGAVEMRQPHLYTFSRSGVAAQGYLAVTSDRVFVPTGRGVPAAFDRKTGRFGYLHLSRYGGKTPWGVGGGDVVATDKVFFNGGHVFDAATGLKYHRLGRWSWWRRVRKDGRLVTGVYHVGERQIVTVTPDGFIRAEGRDVCEAALASKTYAPMREEDTAPGGRRREKIQNAPLLKDKWSISMDGAIHAMIVAGDSIVLGGKGKVAILDRASRKITWSSEVDGAVWSLAAADGRLYAGTDKGTMYCFSGRQVAAPRTIEPTPAQSPYPADAPAAKAAEEIIQNSGVTSGWCLDLGCGEGALACELARRTELNVIGIEPDAAKVAEARRKLDAAGLYGVRVTVLQGDLDGTNLPDYFANLIVSNAALTQGPGVLNESRIARLQRPWGGVVCIGKPGQMKTIARGPLEGAGSWTHQFATAANTMNSGDRIIRGPLGVLWYTDETLETVQRHGKGPAPLFYKGILLRLGVHALKAVDAYNGRHLWQVPLPRILWRHDEDSGVGFAQTGGIYCVADDVVYVRRNNECLLFDVFTGKQLNRFEAPKLDGKALEWTFIACEGGTLFGGLANTSHVIKSVHAQGTAHWQVPMGTVYTESSLLFALDAKTGKLKWTYRPKHSIRNNAVAVGLGRVFIIDRPTADIDQLLKSDVRRRRGEKLPLPEHPTGVLLALDAETGKQLWRDEKDIYGTMLALSAEHDALVMAYQRAAWALQSDVVSTGMACFRASDGKRLWDDPQMKYRGRPIISGRTIYAFPGAWDVLTGEQRTVKRPDGAEEPWLIQGKRFGCAPQTGSANLIMMRSGTLSYYDLACDIGWIENFGGMRPGCWVNAIPAGGMVLVPDDTRGCRCSYLNQATMALQQFGVRPPLVMPAERTFAGTIAVIITHPRDDVEIRYTLDDSYPTAASALYKGPIALTETTTLRSAVFRDGRKLAERDAVTFTKKQPE